MYKKYVQENDYSEYIKDNTVYKCRKDIECENGFFESGSLVMLQLCNSDLEKIYIIDFKSVCMIVKNNPFDCDYVNQIKSDNIWDSAVIPTNIISECFEKADDVNQSLKNIKKAEKKTIITTFMLTLSLLFLLILFFVFALNIEIGGAIIIVVFDISTLIITVQRIRKIHNTFCNSIIYGYDLHWYI